MLKRKRFISIMLLYLLFSSVAFSLPTAYASSYGSNGQIGFYGEYEEPQEDKVVPPADSAPESRTSTELPRTAGRGSRYGITANGKRTLPQTGQVNYFGINLIGYLLVGLLLLLIVKNKKGEQQ
ncbi:LPXTG cell wall anchor domain-containing protein [Enterococcus sp. 669A]|uniref:LPXTG cell wall anchor domain-containing protein n=1 Tax=Candidatus Enterococcus moelleringii TaxID=2815325 RepID=A0ABS3LAR2_9ENTE|nr:LPXTG cell wall anchor domain-containing protein [Enterococcus sp. 669A]MBO1306725.1 LPXTG cell wall anchor domain-containing protein [Enterococcus sp. 669A]